MRKFGVIALVCLAAALTATLAFTQINYSPMPMPRMQFMDSNGVPLAGGFVCTYAAGTSTPLATYTDYTGAVQNPACVPLDSAGRATIFLGNLSYKFVVENSATVPQWTVDGVAGVSGVLAAPPAIGSTTPGPITGTTIVATLTFNGTGTTPYEVNGVALDFTNLAGWPAAGIPCVGTNAWCTSYGTTGSGTVVVLATSPVLVTPNIGVASGTSLALSGAATVNGVVNNDVGITQSGTMTPKVAASSTVGTNALPYSGVYVGGAATNNAQVTGTFTGARTINLADASFTVNPFPSVTGVTPIASRGRSSALTSTTMLTTSVTALYRISGQVACDATATATLTLSCTYTDPSNTVQTLSPSAANCATLGSASVATIDTSVNVETGTAVACAAAITGSPTFDVAATVEQLTAN